MNRKLAYMCCRKVYRPIGLVAITLQLITYGFGSGRAPQSCEESDAFEAVFRFQMRELSSSGRWKRFYLAFGISEPYAPNDEFMKRFDGYKSPVLKFQRGEYNVEQMKKEGGLVIGVYGFKRSHAMEAEVEGYSFLVAGEASGYRCMLSKDGQQWIVKKCKGTWVA